jgi:hypothetical protein
VDLGPELDAALVSLVDLIPTVDEHRPDRRGGAP